VQDIASWSKELLSMENQSVSERKQRAELVKAKITSIYFDSKQRYGSPRMTAELAFRQ
jgi:hypothetical protein